MYVYIIGGIGCRSESLDQNSLDQNSLAKKNGLQDVLELPAAQSGHYFLQEHIDLLTGHVWLVPTFKTATARTAARNFVASVFLNVGLPDVIVSDRRTVIPASRAPSGPVCTLC